MRGTVEFLDSVYNVFLENNICKENKRRKPLEAKEGTKYKAFDKLGCGGNAQIAKMYDWLYKDATIFLPRKEEIARKSKEYLKQNSDKLLINKLNITKEGLLEKLYEFGNKLKTAEYFGTNTCSINRFAKKLNIYREYTDTTNNIYKEYLKYKDIDKISKTLNIDVSVIEKILIKTYKFKKLI